MPRIQPQMPVQAYKTYQVMSPLSTHFRPATCEEVACEPYRNGWRLRVEGLTEQDVHTATHCGRSYTVDKVAEDETWLVFAAGQPCFAASKHRVRLDRPAAYLVRGGDWRGNPLGTVRRHTRPEHWVEDFGEHQQRLADQIEKG